MAVVSTKNLKIWMQKKTITPVVLVPTAISSAKPAVVTVASTTAVAVGDPVTVAGTGVASLDGKNFVISAKTATSVTLAGSDTTGPAIVISGSPTLTVLDTGDMCSVCLSAVDLGDSAATPISVATFCNPSASVPGNPPPASTTMSGYVDVADPCYSELRDAVKDGLPRVIKIDLPGGNGYFVTTVIVGSVGYTVPLEGAVGFTFTGSQSIPLEHVY